MKKDKIIKITLLSLAILACISIPIILYFTIGQEQNTSSTKINLSQQNVNYLADVSYMNSITEQEASTIKGGIQTNVTNKMTSLNLEISVDYTINNLNSIAANTNLGDVTITIDSVASSTKTIGSFNLSLNVREDITNRTIETINVPSDQADSLDTLTASNIQRQIRIDVQDILTNGQANDEDVDYQIVNLNLITAGAKFTDYSTQISVQAITSTNHLKGSFKINFQLQ